MRHPAIKVGPAVWVYRGFTVEYDDERPDGWSFIWGDRVERFARRTQAQAQIDRHLATVQEMAQAPSDAQIGALDLSLYLDDQLLATVQRRLGDLGRPRTRRQLQELAQSGTMEPGKRLMLAAVISSLLGL